MVTTCKDCKHWGAHRPKYDTKVEPEGWAVCGRIGSSFGVLYQGKLLDDDKAYVLEGYDDVPDFRTAPEFFCYHGEAK